MRPRRTLSVVVEVICVTTDNNESVPEGYEVVYTAYITLRNGRRLYAAAYGLTAWRLVVRKRA
jgi:hypothetical protein